MTHYANALDTTPRRLPSTWSDGSNLHMGLPAMSPAQLAALGWYPVRRETLEPGAAGHGDIYMDEPAGEYVIPSLPGDPAAALAAEREGMMCTRLQARLVLIQSGLWDAVVAWFADPARTPAQMAFWEDAQVWKRSDETLAAAAPALGLTDEQIDGLFRVAVTL